MTLLNKRVVAIDYGTKRIGLAQSDLLHLFAQSVGTFSEPELYKQLATIEKEDGIEKILLGNPTNGDGSPNRMTKVVADFQARLQAHFPHLTIEKVSEFGSSKAAMQTLIASGVGKKERNQKGRLDKVAAALMLQHYLETRPKHTAQS
jgi:putative Holliday junction resolvase